MTTPPISPPMTPARIVVARSGAERPNIRVVATLMLLLLLMFDPPRTCCELGRSCLRRGPGFKQLRSNNQDFCAIVQIATFHDMRDWNPGLAGAGRSTLHGPAHQATHTCAP